jgi:exonuclease SbcC
VDAAAEAARRRSEAMVELGLEPDADLDEARREAATARGAAEAELRELEKLIEEAAALEERSTEALARHATLTRLAQDLQPARFLRYLLEEERRDLAALGSDRFEHLSRGRYRFTNDGTFGVVDLAAADSVRKADSLSGGETFLASLALALALAEMVARIGGRLDAFFLDEGFGSLDPEHLDLAMDGIEALVTESGSRLVAVVSHVPSMRDRIDDLVVLDRHPTTGDSVVVSGASRA